MATPFCVFIATQEIDRTNQNQKDEWRREAPPLIFLVLCPKQNLHCYKTKPSKRHHEVMPFTYRNPLPCEDSVQSISSPSALAAANFLP